MPNIPFLEPTALSISGIPKSEIGDYGSTTELNLLGTIPQEINSQSTSTQYAIFSCSGADIYVLRDNETSISASPDYYSFILGDGDNFINFELGKQRHTCCVDEGQSSKLKVSIAQEEIVII